MPATYGIASTTTNVNELEANFELIAGSTNRVYLRDLYIFQNAVSVNLGLGRPPIVGNGPNLLASPPPYNKADPACAANAAISWTNMPPTIPANFLRRIATPSSAGTGLYIRFPRGLVIPVSQSLALYTLPNFGGVACKVSVVFEE